MVGSGQELDDRADAPTVSILLVDDVPANLTALKATLEPLGQRLVTASSGTEALRHLLEEAFAVVLMDVQMPELDGFQTVALIKQRPKTANVPIIFVTAIASELEQISKGYQYGAVDYITKPFDPEILRSKVSVLVTLDIQTERIVRQQMLLLERREQLHRQQVEHAAQLLGRERAARAAIEKTEKRALLLAEASRLLAALDCHTSLPAVARLAVPYFADWSMIDLIEPDGALRRMVAVDGDPAKETVAHQIEAYPGLLFPQESELFNDTTTKETAIRNSKITPETLDALSTLGLHSYIAVPLEAGGSTLGAFVFVSANDNRRYQAEDVAFAEDLAGRAALTVSNARLYQRVENALKARDEFLAIASHELRTPITSLLLTAQSLLEGVYSTSPLAESDSMTRPLRTLYRQTKRLARLVGDMLDVARLQTGQLELRLEETDLVAVVREVTERFESDAARAACAVSLSAGDPVVGNWDRSRLDQVVSNLLLNALLYGAGKPIEIEVRSEGAKALVIVRDHGIGIAQDRWPTSSSASSARSRPRATAVWDWVSISLARSSSVWAAAFTFRASSAPDPRSASSCRWPDPTGTAVTEPGVLIVDDDEDIRTVIGSILKFKGYQVVEAEDGANALEVVRSGISLFLILLDLMMPGMSGEEFKAALDREGAIQKVPMIVLSGDGTIATRAAAMGATGFVRKPFDLFTLVTLVKRYRDLQANDG